MGLNIGCLRKELVAAHPVEYSCGWVFQLLCTLTSFLFLSPLSPHDASPSFALYGSVLFVPKTLIKTFLWVLLLKPLYMSATDTKYLLIWFIIGFITFSLCSPAPLFLSLIFLSVPSLPSLFPLLSPPPPPPPQLYHTYCYQDAKEVYTSWTTVHFHTPPIHLSTTNIRTHHHDVSNTKLHVYQCKKLGWEMSRFVTSRHATAE